MPGKSTSTIEQTYAKPNKSGKSKHNVTKHIGAGDSSVKADDIRGLIADAAYFRAEHRGFNGGNEMEDWLEAEAEIKENYTSGKL